jgi:hypothetical protein
MSSEVSGQSSLTPRSGTAHLPFLGDEGRWYGSHGWSPGSGLMVTSCATHLLRTRRIDALLPAAYPSLMHGLCLPECISRRCHQLTFCCGEQRAWAPALLLCDVFISLIFSVSHLFYFV